MPVIAEFQRMMELAMEFEGPEMWLVLCELGIVCCVPSYGPSYIEDDTTGDEGRDEGNDEENVGADATANLRVLCFYRPWDFLFRPRHVTRPLTSCWIYSPGVPDVRARMHMPALGLGLAMATAHARWGMRAATRRQSIRTRRRPPWAAWDGARP